MATRFARVTVRADEHTVDVSLPADQPIGDLLPQLRDLLSLAPLTAGPWALSTVASGVLDPRRTLAEAGVLDADVLYLSPPEEAPVPPVVDDVIGAVEATLDNDGSAWNDDARRYVCVALAAAVALTLTLAVPFLTLRPVGALGLLVDLGVCSVIAGWLLRGNGAGFVLVAGIPIWTLAAVEATLLLPRLAGGDAVTAAIAAGVAGAGLGCSALALAGERWHGIAAAGAAVVPFGLLAVGLLVAGLSAAATAAVLAVLVAFAAGLAPQLALARSRLVHLLRLEENGEHAARAEVATAVRRGQLALTGAIGGVAVVAALCVVVLVTSDTWFAVGLGWMLGTVFALRSRTFTRTWQVWPMLVPVVVGAAVTLVAVAPGWLGGSVTVATWAAFTGPLVLIAVLALAARPRLGEVGAARLRQVYDLVELVAVLSLVPLAIAVVGGFHWVSG
jgi:type VII secretion integral membrane protein EccD